MKCNPNVSAFNTILRSTKSLSHCLVLCLFLSECWSSVHFCLCLSFSFSIIPSISHSITQSLYFHSMFIKRNDYFGSVKIINYNLNACKQCAISCYILFATVLLYCFIFNFSSLSTVLLLMFFFCFSFYYQRRCNISFLQNRINFVFFFLRSLWFSSEYRHSDDVVICYLILILESDQKNQTHQRM